MSIQHFLSLMDLEPQTLEQIMERALELKSRSPGGDGTTFAGR